jgi:hypothetical protein
MKNLLTASVFILSLLVASEAFSFECCWRPMVRQSVPLTVVQQNYPVGYYYFPVIIQPVVVPVVIRPVIQEYVVPRVEYSVTPIIHYDLHRVYRY